MVLSLKGLQVLCSQHFQVLEICLYIVRYFKNDCYIFLMISFWNDSSCDALKYFPFEFWPQLGVCITQISYYYE